MFSHLRVFPSSLSSAEKPNIKPFSSQTQSITQKRFGFPSSLKIKQQTEIGDVFTLIPKIESGPQTSEP
jgi:hypothetical protein